jgi:hypothetical protein
MNRANGEYPQITAAGEILPTSNGMPAKMHLDYRYTCSMDFQP